MYVPQHTIERPPVQKPWTTRKQKSTAHIVVVDSVPFKKCRVIISFSRCYCLLPLGTGRAKKAFWNQWTQQHASGPCDRMLVLCLRIEPRTFESRMSHLLHHLYHQLCNTGHLLESHAWHAFSDHVGQGLGCDFNNQEMWTSSFCDTGMSVIAGDGTGSPSRATTENQKKFICCADADVAKAKGSCQSRLHVVSMCLCSQNNQGWGGW